MKKVKVMRESAESGLTGVAFGEFLRTNVRSGSLCLVGYEVGDRKSVG